jgi:hypothetical protein
LEVHLCWVIVEQVTYNYELLVRLATRPIYLG